MNFYNISQAPARQQTAQHFHSSLEEPTLQNVEAQLQVARQRNYQLALSYFQNKYGSSEVYNQYVVSNGLEGLGAPEQQEYDLRRELEKQAEQIKQRQLRKIQQKKKGRVDNEEEEEDYQQNSRAVGRKNKNKTNIWAETKQKEEKQPQRQTKKTEEDKTHEQFYEINVGREKEGAFISDFKNYLANKKKLKQQPSPHKNKSLEQSFNLSHLKNNTSSLSQNKSRAADAPKYEQQLVRKMIKDISGKCEPSTRIQKMQLIEYLNANQKITRVLGVPQDELTRTVMGLPSKDSNLLSFNEVLIWVLGALGKAEQIKKLKAQQEFEQVPQGCMLSRDLLGLFQQTFRSMDRHNDLIIKRAPYIARLTNDPLVKRSLNLPAVFEPQYNRHVSLRRIFQRIEIQSLFCSEQQKRLNEYISWNQFMGYFQSGHKARARYDIIILLESLRGEEKFGLTHLPESVFQIINWAIKRADRGEELISTIEIINEIKMHRQYQIEKFTFIKNGTDDGITQVFEDALVRIKQKALKYVSPKQFLQYFSVRGKPIEQYEKDRNEQQSKNLSAVKVTFIENQLFQKPDQPNGYDSDPQIYNNSNVLEKPSQMRKSQKQFKRFKATAQSFMEPQDFHDDASDQPINKQFKLTVPKPFSFEQRQKERKVNRSKQSPTRSKEKQFKAAPVPASVIEIGLYERMMEQQRKKNEERKKCSMIMTLANQKPFSFQNRRANKKTKEERQQFVFRAKPIPWFCSVDLLKKKQEQQILRNERIAKLAQQNLTKAKLPPRMQKDFLQKEAKKMQEQNSNKRPTSSQPRVKEPPNFDRLHRQFEEALQRKRKQNKTTEICEFKFTNNFKSTSKIIAQKVVEEPTKKGQIPSSLKSNVDIMAQSTAKFTQQVQKRRQQMEHKRKEETRKKKQQEQRLKIDEELKQKVQEAAKRNKENKEKEENDKRKEENNRLNQNFQEWKKQCIQKGRKQPLLIDRVSKRDEKIEKMKRLYQISQTLKKNGITGKEHDHYFKREELLLLQDYQHLKDKL